MGSRILIIDDNQSLAENLKDVLEGAEGLDVTVSVAFDGQTGLARAKLEGFDVAVVDVKLPDASGVELIRPLRALSPLGEIVLVTGFATVDAAIAALRAGAFAFVLKSFRPEELLSTVEQALEKIALKREREDYEMRYRAIVEAADVLIVGLDTSGSVLLFNPRIAALTGVAQPDALGKSFVEVFVEESDRRRFEVAVEQAALGKAEVEVSLRAGASALRRVRWHLASSKGRRAARTGQSFVYGIGLDVTDRRALERRAADSEALNAMAPLALGLAHEIRNPLNAAVLQLHLLSRAIDRLADPAIQGPMRARVSVVESEILRLERLLTDFLELARPRAPHREPVDLARVVTEVMDLEAEAVAKLQVRERRELEPGCFAVADLEKLKQVVLNLIVNALDVMPEGGELTTRVSGDEAEVKMSVTDTGPGIDDRHLAEIFDPFFTTKAAGTGLGLAIVRKIVDQHGGRVTVDTRKGGGTTVSVVLPRLHDRPETNEAP